MWFKRCFPFQEMVTAVIGAPGLLFAHFDIALKFEFTGSQNVPVFTVLGNRLMQFI